MSCLLLGYLVGVWATSTIAKNQSRVWLNLESILPIYPVLEVAVPPSTNKCIVHQLINVDIVEKLAEL